MMDRPPWAIEPAEPVSLAEHVACYIERHKLALTPLRRNTKIPALMEWQKRASTSIADWDAIYLPDKHGGVGLVHGPSRTAALDVDHLDSMRLIFAEYGWDYEALFRAFPRTIGNPERDKIFFRLPEGFEPGGGVVRSKLALRWPDPSGECDETGRPMRITVFELRGGDNQDVLPPSVHPDTGRPYRWAHGQAPWELGEIPTIAPDHPLLLIWAQWDVFRDQLERISPLADRNARVICGMEHPIQSVQVAGVGGCGRDVIGQFNRSTATADVLERNGYKRRGKRWLAPHSSTKIPGVIDLGNGKVFSHHGSDVLCNGHAHDAFSLLTTLEHGGIIDAAVSAAAREIGIDLLDPRAPSIDFDAFIANTIKRKKQQARSSKPFRHSTTVEPDPALLAHAPRWLASFLDWGLESAAKPLPHITLQAGLATLSAAASRRYRTNLNNWPSLWFLNTEVTASGKEHPESLIEIALEAAGLGALLGGSGYTSPGAIFSVLLDRPAHIALIDEFGKLMQSSQATGMQHKSDAITLLMQAFSSCHKSIRPPAYSAMGLSAEQRKALSQRKVCNPGVVLFASTTPGTFYDSIDRQRIEDGFLGRFIACNSSVGRQKSVRAQRLDPPASLVEHLSRIGRRDVGKDGAFDTAGLTANSDQPAIPIEMVFSAEAERLLDAFESDVHAQMDQADAWGLAPLYGRTREKAMRLSLLACLAESPSSRTIGATAMEYAIAYAMGMDRQLVDVAKINVADSPFSRVKNACLELIRAAGPRGLTKRELERKSAQFNALKPRDQQDVLGALDSSGLVDLQVQKSASGRGRKRQAWVGIDEESED